MSTGNIFCPTAYGKTVRYLPSSFFTLVAQFGGL